MVKLLTILMGVGAIVMFILASVANFSIGWTIGLVMLIVAAVVALAVSFIESLISGREGNDFGSYRMPKI